MIVDSLRYWVERDARGRLPLRPGVDPVARRVGACRCRTRRCCGTSSPTRSLAGTKLIAEAWDAAGLYQVGSFVGDSWKEWNGRFRDDVRGFFRGDRGLAAALRRPAARQPRDLRPQGARAGAERQLRHLPRRLHAQRPGLLRPQAQRGQRRGQPRRRRRQPELELRRRGPDRRSRRSRQLRNRQVKNFLTVTLLSLGVPMILMGDEVRRTQRGNNNAYCQDNEIELVRLDAAREARRRASLRDAAHRPAAAARHRARAPAAEPEPADPARRTRPGTASSSTSRTGATTRTASRSPSRFARKSSSLHLILNAYWEPLDFELPPVGPGRRDAVAPVDRHRPGVAPRHRPLAKPRPFRD